MSNLPNNRRARVNEASTSRAMLPAGGSGPRQPNVDRDPVLSQTLIQFSGGPWTVADAVEGTQIFGGTGSGKSSGSGATIARAFLAAGMGGLVLTAKADEIEEWRGYLRECGREEDLVEISTREGCEFNLLEYEYREGGKLTQNVVTLLINAMMTGDGKVSSADPYWTEALRELLTHAIDLLVLGTMGRAAREGRAPEASLSLKDLVRLVRTAPQTLSEISSGAWRQRSLCWELVGAASELAEADGISEPRYWDLDQTVAYWLHDYPNLSDRTRSIIVSTFTAKVAGLLRSPLRELFCDKTNDSFSPEASFTADPSRGGRGRVIIVNVPVKTFGEIGRLTQVLYKTIWQRAADRRAHLFALSPSEIESRVASGELKAELARQTCPAFLWADESQYFVCPEDLLFQQTARGSRVATVYLTQNLGNYAAAFGERGDDSKVASLLGNLQTKIFHANGDPKTNDYAVSLYSKHWAPISSSGSNQADSVNRGQMTLSTTQSKNASMQHVPVVDARQFTMLATGGPRFNGQVLAWIFQAGRTWKVVDNETGVDTGEVTNAMQHVFIQRRREKRA